MLSTDIAPTVLDVFGVPVPDGVDGELLSSIPSANRAAPAELAARLVEVTPRRGPVLGVNAWIWALLAVAACVVGRGRGARLVLPLLATGVALVPALLLFTAAIEPSLLVERLIVGVGGLLLAGALLALASGPFRLPPARARFAAFAAAATLSVVATGIDMLFGSPLTALSVLGPSPASGARFFGIGNELEAMIGALLPLGAGAAVTAAGAGRSAPGRRHYGRGHDGARRRRVRAGAVRRRCRGGDHIPCGRRRRRLGCARGRPPARGAADRRAGSCGGGPGRGRSGERRRLAPVTVGPRCRRPRQCRPGARAPDPAQRGKFPPLSALGGLRDGAGRDRRRHHRPQAHARLDGALPGGVRRLRRRGRRCRRRRPRQRFRRDAAGDRRWAAPRLRRAVPGPPITSHWEATPGRVSRPHANRSRHAIFVDVRGGRQSAYPGARRAPDRPGSRGQSPRPLGPARSPRSHAPPRC